MLVSMLSLGLVGCQSSKEDNIKEIKEAYENLLSSEKKYEYVKIVFENGSYTESYRDIFNNIDRTDVYDENGKFESRNIQDNKLLTSIFKDENGNLIGYKEELSDSVMKENAKFNNTSSIDNICKEYISSMLDNKYNSRKEVDGLIKYSDKKNNTVYVDPKTNMIAKVEFEANDNIVGFEFEILDGINEEDLSINAKNKENIDLSETEIEDRGKQEEITGPAVG